MPRRFQSPYPEEFRRQAVALVRNGRNAYEVGRELGVSGESVRKWVQQADRDDGLRDDGLTTQEREELARLRRKVKQLETERAILVKAAAFFAQETERTR
jgi:transposase